MKIDLGTTDHGPEGFDFYVDLHHNPAVAPGKFVQADLTKPWPWGRSSVDLVRAFDIIEHLPDKIFTMNEAWRVLAPGGVLHILVPVTPGAGAWCDPTHVSYWNRLSFEYFVSGKLERERFSGHYGIQACFKVRSERAFSRILPFPSGICEVRYLEIELEAVKS